MRSWTLVVFWAARVAAAFDLEAAVGVVGALQRHFRAGCLFLLPAPEREGMDRERSLTRLWGGLAAQGISTAIRPLGVTLPARHCRNNTPLFVFLGVASLAPLRQMNTTLSNARWLLLLEAGENQDATSLLDGVHVPFDCEFVVARGAVGGGASLSEVYGVLRGQALHVATFGNWSAKQGLLAPGGGLYRRRNNLHGATLQAILTEDPPFETLTVRDNGSVDARGFFSEVWRHLQHRLNFTTELNLAGGMTAGSNQNGSWTGMVGRLQRGEVLLSYNRVTMTASRATVLAYTAPVLRTKACVYLHVSHQGALHWSSYMQPFGSGLWLGVAALFTLLVAVLTAMGGGLSESLLFVWGSFCLQGCEATPRACSARLVLWFSQLTAVILLAAYSAKVIAILAVNSVQPPFNDMEGLLSHHEYKLGVTADSGVFTDFQSATDPVMQEVYQHLLLPSLAQLPEGRLEGLQKACRRPRYAFMTTQDFAAGLQNQLDCDLTELSDACFPVSLGLALAPGAGLRDVIDYHLQEMRHLGLLRALYLRHWPQRLLPAKPPLSSASLWNVVPLLCACVAGGGLAVACLLLELAVFCRGAPPTKRGLVRCIHCHFSGLPSSGAYWLESACEVR